MKKQLLRVLLIAGIAFAAVQLSACDQIKNYINGCESTSENGNTNINC